MHAVLFVEFGEHDYLAVYINHIYIFS